MRFYTKQHAYYCGIALQEARQGQGTQHPRSQAGSRHLLRDETEERAHRLTGAVGPQPGSRTELVRRSWTAT